MTGLKTMACASFVSAWLLIWSGLALSGEKDRDFWPDEKKELEERFKAEKEALHERCEEEKGSSAMSLNASPGSRRRRKRPCAKDRRLWTSVANGRRRAYASTTSTISKSMMTPSLNGQKIASLPALPKTNLHRNRYITLP